VKTKLFFSILLIAINSIFFNIKAKADTLETAELPPCKSELNASLCSVTPPAQDETLDCDPSYPGLCISPTSNLLSCEDINAVNFQVLYPDRHDFDRDGNGIGCEQET
jgi:hypothetical protein